MKISWIGIAIWLQTWFHIGKGQQWPLGNFTCRQICEDGEDCVHVSYTCSLSVDKTLDAKTNIKRVCSNGYLMIKSKRGEEKCVALTMRAQNEREVPQDEEAQNERQVPQNEKAQNEREVPQNEKAKNEREVPPREKSHLKVSDTVNDTNGFLIQPGQFAGMEMLMNIHMYLGNGEWMYMRKCRFRSRHRTPFIGGKFFKCIPLLGKEPQVCDPKMALGRAMDPVKKAQFTLNKMNSCPTSNIKKAKIFVHFLCFGIISNEGSKERKVQRCRPGRIKYGC